MKTAKILHLTNSLNAFTITLREESGTLIFEEKAERKAEGYPKKDLDKLFKDSYKKLKGIRVSSARIVIDGLNNNNVNYILQKLKEKEFGFLGMSVNVISQNAVDPIKKAKSDEEIEWKMIQERLEKMETDGSMFIDIVGIQPNGVMFPKNIRKLIDKGYTVRTVAMRARVKYIVIKG